MTSKIIFENEQPYTLPVSWSGMETIGWMPPSSTTSKTETGGICESTAASIVKLGSCFDTTVRTFSVEALVLW
jgi:hypothetical protein